MKEASRADLKAVMSAVIPSSPYVFALLSGEG